MRACPYYMMCSSAMCSRVLHKITAGLLDCHCNHR